MKLILTGMLAVLVCLLYGLWSLTLAAGSVTLEWQHPGADHYTVYLRTANLTRFVPVAVVTGRQATIYRDARRNYWYCVTATGNGQESAPSETLYLPRR